MNMFQRYKINFVALYFFRVLRLKKTIVYLIRIRVELDFSMKLTDKQDTSTLKTVSLKPKRSH